MFHTLFVAYFLDKNYNHSSYILLIKIQVQMIASRTVDNKRMVQLKESHPAAAAL